MKADTLRELSKAKPEILDADMLLFRGKGIISRFIRSYGRGRYSHVAKASWLKGELFCLEVRELKGGRAVTLESQVKKFPGQIDVFRTNALNLPAPNGASADTPTFNRKQADQVMLMFAGVEYGYMDLATTWLLHLWGVRLFATANVDDEFVSQRPPYCSAACAIADRVGGGVDTVPQLADKNTEPNDLARSPFYRYLFTLVPDTQPEPDGRSDTPPAIPTEANAASEIMLESAEAPPVPLTDIVPTAEQK